MAQRITVDDLVSDIRQQLDEDNTVSVSDSADILPALNRGQNYALDILARHYPASLLTNTTVQATAGEDEYDIPEDAFEQRLLKVEINQNGTFFELLRIDYLDAGLYETASNQVSIPYYYSIVGQKFKVYPASTGAYDFRVWYLRDPLPLIKQQGRINTINTASNYIIVDAVGDDVSTSADNLSSFVSIIDGATGIRKGTLQVQSISGTRITFKTVPTRSIVLDLTVDSDLGALSTDLVPAQDDYICISSGTCVPFLKKPLSNFLVQYSVAEITRKLGGEAGIEEQVLQKFEEQIKRTWVQRPNATRVRKRNANWAIPVRRAQNPST